MPTLDSASGRLREGVRGDLSPPVLARDWRDDSVWQGRLRRDGSAAGRHLRGGLWDVHKEVVARARAAGAAALILTGSTARDRRTAVSDLDYMLVGAKIVARDLPEDLDIHTVPARDLIAKVRSGDDFVHWSLLLGCIVFDDGVVRRCCVEIRDARLLPDADRKAVQARKSLGLAAAMVASEDEDAALEQVRTALTLLARWWLLRAGIFPFSRAELPAQLEAAGVPDLAADLRATIEGGPSLKELGLAVRAGTRALEVDRAAVPGESTVARL